MYITSKENWLMSRFDYDVVIIGGGAAGLMAAKVIKGLGKKVVIIEKNKLGGECTWTGCVPSKALIKAAQVAYLTKHRARFGLGSDANKVDTTHVMAHVKQVIQNIYSTHTPQELENLGIEVIFGTPYFLDKHTLAVSNKSVTAKKFIIATGSRPFIPLIEGLDSVDYLTNETLFELDQLPDSMVILGGGVVGCEMGMALNRLGVQVTIVEAKSAILSYDDRELSRLVGRHMMQEGVALLKSTKVESVSKQGDEIELSCVDVQGQQVKVSAQSLLIAVGRRPNVQGLALDTIGIATNPKGIIVDKHMRTNAKNVYACGDVVGPYRFAHMAGNQAIVAARNVALPFKTKINYSHVSWVTFVAPELAGAGMTERQARAAYGDSIAIYRYEYAKLDRANVDMQTTGMGKFICDKKGRLIGAHIWGARAGELIHEVQLGKRYGISLSHFYSVIHAYPTYSELIWQAARKAYIKSLRNNIFVRFFEWVRNIKIGENR